MRPAWAIVGIRQFCKLPRDKVNQLKSILARNNSNLAKLSLQLELAEGTVSARVGLGQWFSQGEYSRIKEIYHASDEELMKCFDFSKEGLEVIKRSGNGYSMDFTAGGKEHTVYGKTELECKVNAENRKKEIEQAETPSDSITLKITKSEAIKLSYTLVRAIDKCNEDGMRNALTSLYFRISSQVI